MDQLGGAGGGAGGEVLPLDEAYAETPGGGVEGDAAAGGTASDDEEVEGVDGAAAHEHRLLDCPGGDDHIEVSDLPPSDLEGPTIRRRHDDVWVPQQAERSTRAHRCGKAEAKTLSPSPTRSCRGHVLPSFYALTD